MSVPRKHLMFRAGDSVMYTPSWQDDDIVYPAVVLEVCDNPDVYMISYTNFSVRTIITCVGADQLQYVAKRERDG